MAELGSSSSSAPSQSILQQKLKNLIESQQSYEYYWSYIIFWQTSKDQNHGGQLLLSWRDGHFRGATNHCVHDQLLAASPQLDFMDYCSSPIQDITVMDPEWFYLMSVARSFSPGDGSIHAISLTSSTNYVWLCGPQQLSNSQCERVREAQANGIQTFVSVSISGGVLELASTFIIPQNMNLVQQANSLFASDLIGFAMPQSQDVPASFAAGDEDIDACCYLDIDVLDNSSAEIITTTNNDNIVSAANTDTTTKPPVVGKPPPKKRGRKPAVVASSVMNHVESERQRREKLNNHFYTLRAAVPNVTKMDKASILADAVNYINQLKSKVDDLESQLQELRVSSRTVDSNDTMENNSSTTTTVAKKSSVVADNVQATTKSPSICSSASVTLEIDVKIISAGTISIRVRSENAVYPAEKLMKATRELGLEVMHASIFNVSGTIMLQDVVIRVSADSNQQLTSTEDAIKSAVFKLMKT